MESTDENYSDSNSNSGSDSDSDSDSGPDSSVYIVLEINQLISVESSFQFILLLFVRKCTGRNFSL